MIVQTEEKDYARDLNSKALINNNISAFQEHRAKTNRLKALEEKTEKLASDIDEIKSMLKQLLDR